MASSPNWFSSELERRGVSRRDFVTFCGTVAGLLALPKSAGATIAKALERGKKPVLVWLEFQDCAGCSESLLRASKPTTAQLVLETLSLDYHETIMAAAGHQAEEALQRTIKENAGNYLVAIEGSIPADGAYCSIGGRAARDIAREVCANAAATIAVGTCASYGGLAMARPNPTGAMSVAQAVPEAKALINLPACPANAENITALIVYYLTYKRWPPLDSAQRPLFAYGKAIHDNCERRAHFDAAQFVEAFGDAGHRKGYCLYKVGCKGPVTFQNCPVVRWNEGTNWPVGCGHPCIGCAEPQFWDRMTPFYTHLQGFPGVGLHAGLDTVGSVAAAGVIAGIAGHALVGLGRRKLLRNFVVRGDPALHGKPPEAKSPTGEKS